MRQSVSAPLELESSGPSVTALQQALLAKGFDPHGTDGEFGPATELAVRSFQQSLGLAADGVVGPITARALGLAQIPDPPPPMSPLPSAVGGVTVAIVAKMFPQTPVTNIQANLPAVLNALEAAGIPDKAMVLMALATIRAETGCFRPISEGISHFNTTPGGPHPFDLYDDMPMLGNQGAPDGANFCGRGFVQLTGRSNYTFYATEIGKDLVGTPALANDPAIASMLLARFLRDKQLRIRTALGSPDQVAGMAAARRAVNGGTNGLAEFTSAYQIGLQLIP
jgi:putative chitinase